MEELFVMLSSYFIFKFLFFVFTIILILAPLFIWKYVKKSSQIQLDTLIAIENQNKILLELTKATRNNENLEIDLEERIRKYDK